MNMGQTLSKQANICSELSNKLVSIRTANISDLGKIWELSSIYFSDCNNISFEEFYELWQYRWINNPFRRTENELGWVLETNGGDIVGFFGSIPLEIKIEDKYFPALSASSWVVDPQYRSKGLLLLEEFFKLGDRRILLNTTANKIAATWFEMFDAHRIPVKDYNYEYLWYLRWGPVISRFVKRKIQILNRIKIDFIFNVLGFIFDVWFYLSRRRIAFKSSLLKVYRISFFNEDIDLFLKEQNRKYSVLHQRTCKILNWRLFNLPKVKGTPFCFVCRDTLGKVMGYVSLRRLQPPEGPEEHYIVTDLLYTSGRKDVLFSLLNYAFRFAKKNGGYTFQIYGFNEDVNETLLTQKPIKKIKPAWSYWYKCPSADLDKICAKSAWWSSGIDGDLNM